MSMKIIAAAIIGLMLVVLPIGYVQNVEAATEDVFKLGSDPMAMLSQLWKFITEQGPQLVGQIFQIVMAVVLSFVAFLQTGLVVLINPQGIPLLFSMIINGVACAFSYAMAFAIYGSIIGAIPIGIPFWPLTIIGGAILGAIAGIIFGFLYGLVHVANPSMEEMVPDEFVNPFIKEGWEEAIFPS